MDEFEKFFDSITPAGSYDAHDPTHRALRYTQEIAWRAGREAGMREAAGILGRRIGECDNMVASAPLTQRGINLYEDAARELIAMEAVILAAIGEGE